MQMAKYTLRLHGPQALSRAKFRGHRRMGSEDGRVDRPNECSCPIAMGSGGDRATAKP